MFNSKKQINVSRELARAYRYKRPFMLNEGAVITYMGNVTGWRDAVRDPQDYCPGCLAFTANEEVYEARGGDNHSGAREWFLLPRQRNYMSLSHIEKMQKRRKRAQEARIAAKMAAQRGGDA